MTGDRLASHPLTVDELEFISKLYLSEYDKLISYSRCIFGADFAEDLVQDAFLLCTLKIAEVKSHESPIGWMYTTIRNLSKNARRKQAVLRQLMDALELFNRPSPTVADNIPFAVACNDWLPDSDWAILYDYYCNGVSYAELAKQRNSTVAACKMQVVRAKKELKKRSKETC